ncbi:MAG: hypothetical protein OXI15_16760, partial [Chromatiales bacterium]|nr:hypothetical protein [Chromatiales bacterium]
ARAEAAQAEEDRRADALREARADLDALDRELLEPYPAAVAAIDAWRTAMVAAFEDAGLAAEEYAGVLDSIVAQRLREAAEEEADRRIAEGDRWVDGARGAFERYLATAEDAAAATDDIFAGAFQSAEDALTQFVLTGELDFGRFVDSIVADLARLAVRQAIVGAFSAAFGGGGIYGTVNGPVNGTVAHAGGVAGDGTVYRQVPAAAFTFAPRLHAGGVAGIGPDEVPTILRRGEIVIPPEALGTRSAEPMTVRVRIENRGTPGEVRDARAEVDPRGMVISIVTDDLANGGPIARSIQSVTPGMRL